MSRLFYYFIRKAEANIFFIVTLVYFLRLYFFEIRPGLIFSLIVLIIWGSFIYRGSTCFKKENILFTIYLLMSIFSGINYLLIQGMDSKLFFYGIQFNVLPMALYLSGMISAKKKDDSILKNIILSNIIIISVGLLLYFLLPDFFINFLYQFAESTFSLTYYKLYPRLMSIFANATSVGTISAVSIPLIFMFYNKYKFNFIYFLGLLSLFLLGAFLSMQRSAWIASFFALIISYIIFILYQEKKFKTNVKLLIFVVIVVIIMYVIPLKQGNVMSFAVERFYSIFNTDVTKRWIYGISVFEQYPFGIGIGRAGHKAIQFDFRGVPDGNYFRIISELGILGILTFLLISTESLINSFKYNPYLFVAICVYLVQAVASNIIDFAYTGSIFWFIIGYSNNLKVNLFKSKCKN